MSSPKSLFGETVSKKPRIDNDDKQEPTTSRSTERLTPSAGVRKPAFNPALLSSAFYTGPTMYGGAGACNSSSPFNQYAKSKFFDRKKTDIKVSPGTPETSMSQTSRRILDLLEQYSSPISDAKRVPINNRPSFSTQKKTLNTSSVFDISKKSAYEDPPTPNATKANRFRELQIPSMATLMKIKKNNRSGGNVQAAIIASMSSSLPYKPETYSLRSGADNTYKNKMKTKISSRASKVDEDEMAQPVNLPNISLRMTGLPTFSMEPFKAQVASPKPPDKREPALFSSSTPQPASNFKFTSPVAVAKVELPNVTQTFTFSEPLDIFSPEYNSSQKRATEAADTPKDDLLFKSVSDGKTAYFGSDAFSTVKKPSKPEVTTPFVNFKSGDATDSPKASAKRPAEHWNGTKDDGVKDSEKVSLLNGDSKSSHIFGKIPNKSDQTKSTGDDIINPNIKKLKSDVVLPPSPISGLESFIKKQRVMWECSSCMTRNDPEKAKCVCCEMPKPGTAAVSAADSGLSGMAGIVKKQREQWECSSCFTRNDPDKVKCVCCETPGEKPGSKPAPAPSANLCYTGMASFIMKQQEQWECSVCMTRNDQNRAKCVCCEGAKPGGEPPKAAAAAAATFSFGNTPNTFKFGIDKADEPIEPLAAETKAAVEIPKVSEAPALGGFVFGNPATVPEVKPANGPVGGFKFGVTAPANPIAAVTPVSKSPITFGDKKEDGDAPVSVGGFSFGFKKTENSGVDKPIPAQPEVKSNLFSFSAPKIVTENKVEPEKPKPAFMLPQAETKPAAPPTSKPEETFSFTSVPPATGVNSTPVFTFGSAASEPPAFGIRQFGAVATPSTTVNAADKPAAGLFNFGAKPPVTAQANENKSFSDLNSTPKPAFPLQLPVSNSPFSSAPLQGNNIAKNTLPSLGSGLQFNATPAKNPADQPLPSLFSFSSSTATTTTANTFNSPPSNAPVFSFGGSSTFKPDSAIPLFTSPSTGNSSSQLFRSKPTESSISNPPQPGNSLFKLAPSTTTSSFQSPTSNVFGSVRSVNSQMPSTNLFGTGSLTGNKNTVPTFGSAAVSEPPQPASFSNSAMPTSTFNSGSIFGSTARPTAAPIQSGLVFGSPAASLPEVGSSSMFMNNPQPSGVVNTGGIFGSSIPTAAAPAPTGIFGSSGAVPFREPAQSQAPQSLPFNFGSASSNQPVVGFGRAPSAGSAAPVFSFGSGASPVPALNSQFNFTMGAPGAAAGAPQRKIKKAVRRNNVLR